MSQPPVLLVPKRYVDVPDESRPGKTVRVPDIPPSVTSWGQVNDDLDTKALPFATKRPIITATEYDIDDLKDWGAMSGNRMRRLDARGAQWFQDARDKQRGPAFRRAARRKLAREAEAYARVEVVRRRRIDVAQGLLLPLLGNLGMYGLAKAFGIPEEVVLGALTMSPVDSKTFTHEDDMNDSGRQALSSYTAMDGYSPLVGDGTWNSPSGEAYYACYKASNINRMYGSNNGNSYMAVALENTTIDQTRHFSMVMPYITNGYRTGAVVAYDHSTRVDYDTGDYYEAYMNTVTSLVVRRCTTAGNTVLATISGLTSASFHTVELVFDDSWLEAYEDATFAWQGRDTTHSAGGHPGLSHQSNQGALEWGAGDLPAVPGGGGGSASPGVGRVSLGRRGLRFS